jgi:hypothetical protein
MDFVTPLIKAGIDLVKGGLAAARRRLGKGKYNQLLSAVIMELLKQDPDLTAAEAQLAAARATGVNPDMNLLRAQSMLHTTQSYVRAAKRARWARHKAAKKKPPRRVGRPRPKRKRSSVQLIPL